MAALTRLSKKWWSLPTCYHGGCKRHLSTRFWARRQGSESSWLPKLSMVMEAATSPKTEVTGKDSAQHAVSEIQWSWIMLGATGVGQCAFVKKKNWMGLSQASERPSELSALFFQGLLASFQLLLGLRSFGFSWLSCTVSVSVTVCKCFPLVLTISPSYHQSLELGPTLNISIHSHEPYTPYEALFLNNNHILRV